MHKAELREMELELIIASSQLLRLVHLVQPALAFEKLVELADELFDRAGSCAGFEAGFVELDEPGRQVSKRFGRNFVHCSLAVHDLFGLINPVRKIKALL
jgi:hypothetical protein